MQMRSILQARHVEVQLERGICEFLHTVRIRHFHTLSLHLDRYRADPPEKSCKAGVEIITPTHASIVGRVGSALTDEAGSGQPQPVEAATLPTDMSSELIVVGG